MKLFVLVIGLFISISAFAVQTIVSCTSYYTFGNLPWVETQSKLRFTAYVVQPENDLHKAELSGAYQAAAVYLKADPNYVAKKPQYFNMNRYGSMRNARCWFDVLLPKNLAYKTKPFSGYTRLSCGNAAEGTHSTLEMKCNIIKKLY